MKNFFIFFFCLNINFAHTQTFTGTFPALSHQWVKLNGNEGFKMYTIDSVLVNKKGQFTLSYTEKDHGIVLLATTNDKPYIVTLASNENIIMEGESGEDLKSVVITSGKQNQLFAQYSLEYPKRELVLSAWNFLVRIYHTDTLFAIHSEAKYAIEAEKHRIHEEDSLFLANLDPDSYLAWYLSVIRLVNSVRTLAEFRSEEIPEAIESFRDLDYADHRLYKSGLLQKAIEAQFWLIGNHGLSMDSVIVEMNKSIDRMIEKLVIDEKKLNEVTDYLFHLLERHSLFASSEYLALKVLNEVGCTMDQNLERQLESYRTMKIGNVAPDIIFGGEVLKAGMDSQSVKRLSGIISEYKVIIFGASWCPKCTEELSQILHMQNKLESVEAEVIFISLDTEATAFRNFVHEFPFMSMCDYRKWESLSARDYHVFATPTIYVLDRRHEILFKPSSVSQLDAWVDGKLLAKK